MFLLYHIVFFCQLKFIANTDFLFATAFDRATVKAGSNKILCMKKIYIIIVVFCSKQLTKSLFGIKIFSGTENRRRIKTNPFVLIRFFIKRR